jgi:PAS domain S-box-containing protein
LAAVFVRPKLGSNGVSQASHQFANPACLAQHTRTRSGFLGWLTVLAVGYFVTAKLGLMVPTVANNVTLVWPPTGLAVFALFCWGRRYWPGVAVGALAINLTSLPAWTAVGIAIGNTLATLAATYLLRAFRFHGTFDSRRDVIGFTAFGALVPMLVSAVNGTTWLLLAGVIDWDQFVRTACIWWAGDAAGVLVVGPVLFGFPAQFARWRREGVPIGAGIWLLVIAAVSAVVFTGYTPVGRGGWAVAFVPLLLLAWANIGYRGWVASLGVVITCGVGVVGTAAHAGPFANPVPDVELFQAFAYIVTVSLVTLTVSAVLGEREAVERVLSTREAEYRALVEDTPALIVRFTRSGVLTFANDTYCRFKGQSREALRGTSIDELMTGPSKEAVRQLFGRFERDGVPLTYHGAFVDSTGAERWIEWKGRAEADEVQVVGLDVTERRLAEQERQRLEERMVRVQKMESLGAIAGGVAHDFNNLLTGVLGHADLALSYQPPHSPARKHLEEVAESAGRAADLSRQLLAYAGKGQLLIRQVDLNGATNRAIELGAKLVPNGVTVKPKLAPNLPGVEGDESQLQQLILNLFRNAVEAIGNATGTVELTTGSTDVSEHDLTDPGTGQSLPAGRYVWVRVHDTGGGIPRDLLPKIFDPFVTTKFMGRGLGLAAAQGIVRAHGGSIRVDTAATGTTFTVLFPASSVPAPAPAQHKTTLVTRLDTDRRRTVLVVDDEEGVRELTAHMVRQLGWEVMTAHNGVAATKLFAAHAGQIRFVVMDLTMPEMDGWQALQIIRRTHPQLPVLLSTGHSEDSVPNADPDHTAVLLKPFRIADLERAVSRLLHCGRPMPVSPAGG